MDTAELAKLVDQVRATLAVVPYFPPCARLGDKGAEPPDPAVAPRI